MPLGRGLQSLIPSKNNSPAPAVAPAPLSGDKVWQLPVDKIVPNSKQPRRDFNAAELDELADSIREHGILQPLLVTEHTDGQYELIAGERRWRAAQLAGLATVPAIVRPTPEQEKLELAIIENVQRVDLNPIDEAFAYQRLHDEFGLTMDQIGVKVGKSRPHVSNIVRLLGLPEEAKTALIQGKITMGKARALLSLTSTKEQLEVLQSMLGEGMTTRQVEDTVSLRVGRQAKNKTVETQYLESELRGALGTKVTIRRQGDKGTIIIDFYSHEELENLVTRLKRS